MLGILLCIVWPAFSAQNNPVYSDNAADSSFVSLKPIPHHKGLLWKIKSKNAEPSFLFGTIHSDDPRVTELPQPVMASFNQSASFTMEMILEPTGLSTMAEALFLEDEENLKYLLGPELYEQTQEAIIAHGLSPDGMDHLKPWVIIMMLNMPRPKTGMFLDLKLQFQAVALGKPIHGLETLEEQIAVFDELPINDQIELLRETIEMSSQINEYLEELIQAYLARDLGALETISTKFTPKNKKMFDSVMDRLLNQRNHRMLKRMLPRLREGKAFIAVGALHLPGEQGLLNLLQQHGFQLSPLY